jgi:hypothetical protein
VFDPELRADHWYTRSIAQFIRDARDSAAGEHVLGVVDPDSPPHDNRRLTRLLRWTSRRWGTWAMSVAAAGTVALVASATGFDRGEEFAARALWRLGRERGLLDVRDRVATVEG